MDQFVTTYRKDYLWPYLRSIGKRLTEPPLPTAGFANKCNCVCYPPQEPINKHEPVTFDTQSQDWSRIGPMGPLLDPKLYPVQLGKPPQTDTMHLDQPNTFLKKLKEKYPYLYEILQTSPTADLLSNVNKDRLRTTYQVDFCKMNEYGPVEIARVSGTGKGPCSEPVRLPGDPYRPQQKDLSFKFSLENKLKTTQCPNSSDIGGGSGGKGGGAGVPGFGGGGGSDTTPWQPGISEYADGISKIGGLIIKDKMHYHTRKRKF